MELFNYYSVDECKDRKKVFGVLDQLKEDGKIDYEMDGSDLFRIEDLDLEEDDIEDLNKLFDSEDVFPYIDNFEDGDDDDGYDDYDENDDY